MKEAMIGLNSIGNKIE